MGFRIGGIRISLPSPSQVLLPPKPPMPPAAIVPAPLRNVVAQVSKAADKAYNVIAAPIRSTIAADPLLSWAENGKWSTHSARTKAGVHELYKEDRLAQRLGVREKDVVTVVNVVAVVVVIYFGGSFLASGSSGAGAGAAGASSGTAAAGAASAGTAGAGAAAGLTVGEVVETGMTLYGAVNKVKADQQAKKDKAAQDAANAELAQVNAEIAAEQAKAGVASEDQQKKTTGAAVLVGGGLVALKLLALL